MTTADPDTTAAPQSIVLTSALIESIVFSDLDIPFAVIITDALGTVTHWNQYATTLYGWSPEEAIGRSIVELNVGPLDESMAVEIMGRLGNGEKWGGTFDCRRRDGSAITVNVLDVPLRDADGDINGIVGFSREIVEQFADTLQALDELRAMYDRLDEVRTAEQQRIAAQLHDHLSQPIAMMATEALRLARACERADDAVRMERIGRSLQESLRTLQTICTSLRPPGLDEFGPVMAMENMLEAWPATSGVLLESAIDPAIDRVDPTVVEVVIQVLTEALANVERHARATHAIIDIVVDGDICTLSVVDDGRGFHGESGFGVRLMTERARRVGGRLEIESRAEPDSGTALTLRVPTTTR